MSTHNFLFTYSVSPFRQINKNIADTIRNRIAELNGKHSWEKLSNVETAFKGEVYLVSSLLSAKRQEAERDITNILKTVFDNEHPEHAVYIHVALFVDGLKEVIEFSI